MNVPKNVEMLFAIPCNPMILFVAIAINEMLVTMRNVRPPLFELNCVIHSASPRSKSDFSGKWIPPFRAKLTELNSPPMIKKNSNILMIPRFIGLRVSAGLIARPVSFNPNKNPTNIVGKYASSIMYGMFSVNLCICGAKTKNNNIAAEAAEAKIMRLTKEKRRSPYTSAFQLYIF
jgi:hypothetical protein